MEDYETVLLVKPEVFVYKIPPRTTNRGYRAADWKLDTPDWTGRMRVVAKGKECIIKLEDKNTGELFSKSPVDKYPGIAVEAVMDSSRYFVLRIQDDGGRTAFIGIGFADRGDSFDLNVALQEHFKWLQKTEEIEQGTDIKETKPQLDLSFKEGQTITINMNIGKKSGSSKPRPKPSGSGMVPGLLPPPPGGVKIPSPLSTTKNSPQEMVSLNTQVSSNVASSGKSDLLLDLDSPTSNSVPAAHPSIPVQQTASSDLWGDFTTAAGNDRAPNQNSGSSGGSSNNWIDF